MRKLLFLIMYEVTKYQFYVKSDIDHLITEVSDDILVLGDTLELEKINVSFFDYRKIIFTKY